MLQRCDTGVKYVQLLLLLLFIYAIVIIIETPATQVHDASIGIDGAQTNCRIAHVLGILLMISY